VTLLWLLPLKINSSPRSSCFSVVSAFFSLSPPPMFEAHSTFFPLRLVSLRPPHRLFAPFLPGVFPHFLVQPANRLRFFYKLPLRGFPSSFALPFVEMGSPLFSPWFLCFFKIFFRFSFSLFLSYSQCHSFFFPDLSTFFPLFTPLPTHERVHPLMSSPPPVCVIFFLDDGCFLLSLSFPFVSALLSPKRFFSDLLPLFL